MSYLDDKLARLGEHLARTSRWLDEHPPNTARDPEAATWGRLAKVSEESGEVIAAFIGATGQNPRKGVTHTRADVEEELLDVALTALAAYEHLTNNESRSADALLAHVEARMRRVGLL